MLPEASRAIMTTKTFQNSCHVACGILPAPKKAATKLLRIRPTSPPPIVQTIKNDQPRLKVIEFL